jgi:hypothetical protein
VGGEHGHLSNGRAAEVLRAVAHPGLRHVVLGHVSRHNNTPELALASARAALAGTAFGGELHAAAQDHVLGPLVVGAAPPAAEPAPRSRPRHEAAPA